jgi:hypothetical protein
MAFDVVLCIVQHREWTSRPERTAHLGSTVSMTQHEFGLICNRRVDKKRMPVQSNAYHAYSHYHLPISLFYAIIATRRHDRAYQGMGKCSDDL